MERNFEEFCKVMDEKFAEIEQREKELEDAYNSGVEAGIKQMMDKIQRHCELGKPVMANGELYFFKTAQENLIDIMDDIEADWKAEQGMKKFIVPIRMIHTKGEIVREVIIETNKAETAMLIAIGDFQHNGWIVDTDFNNYKTME